MGEIRKNYPGPRVTINLAMIDEARARAEKDARIYSKVLQMHGISPSTVARGHLGRAYKVFAESNGLDPDADYGRIKQELLELFCPIFSMNPEDWIVKDLPPMKTETKEPEKIESSGIEDVLIALDQLHRDNMILQENLEKAIKILSNISMVSTNTFEETRKVAWSANNIRKEIAPESGNSSGTQ